ncbi:RNA polymerase sigma factor [Gaoshiqia sp. Z1-71]|uniref:RNA polymerase sigma factor n=1 Tax=Gaoshiqia hydrogeniformans TaxID=3290090 RepID=UPI003BF7F60E
MKETSTVEEMNQLTKRIRQGDIKAFDLLYAQFSERLFGFAFSMLKNHEDAKEVVQETFLKLWKKRDQLDSSQSVKALLFSVSYHIVIDLLRKRLKENQYLQELHARFAENEPGADHLADYNELNNELQKAISALPEQRKKIYQLSREEGLSHKEIAGILNISVKTVENQINLALKTIRRQLDSGKFLNLLFIVLFL